MPGVKASGLPWRRPSGRPASPPWASRALRCARPSPSRHLRPRSLGMPSATHMLAPTPAPTRARSPRPPRASSRPPRASPDNRSRSGFAPKRRSRSACALPRLRLLSAGLPEPAHRKSGAAPHWFPWGCSRQGWGGGEERTGARVAFLLFE